MKILLRDLTIIIESKLDQIFLSIYLIYQGENL